MQLGKVIYHKYMKSSTLVLLAYNEELNIKNSINELFNEFNHILIVNDNSTDKTREIIEKLQLDNQHIYLINNSKNYGAGKSLQIGIDYIKSGNIDTEIIVKIDGDNQFDTHDILKIKELLENNLNVEFIKSNRFWRDGIKGNMPTKRFIGNSFANFWIKLNTGNFQINDPLNGLFGFRISFLKKIQIPKLFNRYGYPFYLNSFSVLNNIQTLEIKNTINYNTGTTSQLKAFRLFLKLIYFSIIYFFYNLKQKSKVSNLQISVVLDIFWLFLFSSSFIPILKIFQIRYEIISGLQSNWLIIFLTLQSAAAVILYLSKTIENSFRKNYFQNEFEKS